MMHPDETTNISVIPRMQIDRIVSKPGVCGGCPCIKGTRISVGHIVAIRNGLNWGIREILDAYPHVQEEDIDAALFYYAVKINE